MKVKTPEAEKNLFIGTSGYYFDDWVGSVYPKSTKKTDMFDEYQKLGFDSLELNFTYYRLADKKQLKNFSEKASGGFSFIIKAYKGITHEKARKETLLAVSENYRDGNSRNNFKGMLLQFPESFHKTKENIEYLLFLRETIKDIDLFAEFRRFDWINEETFSFLKENKMLYVCSDLPKIGNLPAKTIESTGASSYIRLHGRNKEWYTAKDRYDYLYSMGEINEFQTDIVRMMGKTNASFVFFNNCHGGFAVKNALMLIEKMKKENFLEKI